MPINNIIYWFLCTCKKAGRIILTATIGISQEVTFYLVMNHRPFTISDKA